MKKRYHNLDRIIFFNDNTIVLKPNNSLDYTVIIDKNTDFTIPPNARAIFVKSIDNINELRKIIILMKKYLQGVTLVCKNDKFNYISNILYNLGINWCAVEGMIQMPPFGWLNSGMNEIAWLKKTFD